MRGHSTAWIYLLPLAFVIRANTKTAAPEIESAKGNSSRLLPLVINTWNYTEANKEAWRILNLSKGGLGETRNAVVGGISKCESLQCARAVGYGGSPNERGETSLDAMVMDGGTMEVGAVANLRRFNSAIRLARYVLEHTNHTLLVGEGAEDFAYEMGLQNQSLITPESTKEWMQWRNKSCQPNFRKNVSPDPRTSCGPYTPVTPRKNEGVPSDHKIGPGNHDTITMIAIDVESNIHVGTSTNGLHHSMPGRVGDAPIVGAGAYADNEVGAAVTTGNGDIMMRFLPSFFAVEAMRSGRTPKEAATLAMNRIKKHFIDFDGAIVAVNRIGEYFVICHNLDGNFTYAISSPLLPDQPNRKETINCTFSLNKGEIPFSFPS